MAATVNIDPYVKGLVKATSTGSVELIMNEKNGFFHDPQLDIGGLKTLSEYCAQERAQTLAGCLQLRYNIRATYQVHPDEATDERAAGTFYHPALLLDYAAWVSPEVYAHSANIVAQVLAVKKFDGLRNAELWKLWSGEDKPICQKQRKPPVWLWSCNNPTLLVDERGWLNSEDLFAQSRCPLTLSDFARRPEVAPLAEYLRRRGLLERRDLLECPNCHPLLALRYAVFVGADCYLKCARLVFCHGRQPLNRLFREQFEAAVACEIAPPPRDHASTSGQTAARATDASTASYAPVDVPSTSTSTSNRAGQAPSKVIEEATDASQEADRGQTLAACREMWDQERRSLQKDVERERAATDAALAQVRKLQAQMRELEL